MASIQPTAKELKKILAPMTWRQRIDYLWTYYKYILGIALGVVALISIIVSCIQLSQIEHIYNGILLNVPVTEQGKEALSDGVLTYFEADGKKQVVDLQELSYVEASNSISADNNQATLINLTVTVAAKSVDYVLCDEYALNTVVLQRGYADLRTVLTQQQISQLEAYFVWTKATEETESYPAALDISYIPFAQSCAPKTEKLYLLFPGNSDNMEKNSDFLDYLLKW